MRGLEMVDETADVGVSGGYTFQDGNLVSDLLIQSREFRMIKKQGSGDLPCVLVRP